MTIRFGGIAARKRPIGRKSCQCVQEIVEAVFSSSPRIAWRRFCVRWRIVTLLWCIVARVSISVVPTVEILARGWLWLPSPPVRLSPSSERFDPGLGFLSILFVLGLLIPAAHFHVL